MAFPGQSFFEFVQFFQCTKSFFPTTENKTNSNESLINKYVTCLEKELRVQSTIFIGIHFLE